jgi:hypothetical protein
MERTSRYYVLLAQVETARNTQPMTDLQLAFALRHVTAICHRNNWPIAH